MGKEGGRKEEPGKVVFKTDMMSLQEPDKVDLRHCFGALHCHQGGYFTVTHKHCSRNEDTYNLWFQHHNSTNQRLFGVKKCDTGALYVTPVMSWCMLASFQVSKILNIY